MGTYNVQEVLKLEEEIRKLDDDVRDGRITREQAEELRQLKRALIALEESKRVSQETLSWRIDI